MDRLRKLINHVTAQLSVLTLSQRVAIGLCTALVASSIFWLMRWSVEPDLVPLVKTEFTFDQLQAAEEALSANGAKYQTRGTRIYVRATEKHNLIRVLHQADAIPDDGLYTLAEHVAEQNPFQAPEARKAKETYALGNELAKIIATSPLVDRARVIINTVTKRRLGRASDVPTASVLVTPASAREVNQEMVDWLAKLVSGAVAGLRPYNVSVSDARTGRAFSVPHPDEAMGIGYLAEMRKREQHLLAKIIDKLAYIPGVRATVTIELDNTKRTAEEYTYDKPQAKNDITKETSTNAGGGATEPGAQANVGTALTANQGKQSSSTEETTTENFPGNLTKTERTETQALATTGVTATVSIPRSFIVGLYKLSSPEAEDPTDEELALIRDEQIKQVTGAVMLMVGAREKSDVQVDVYPDMQWDTESGPGWGVAGVTVADAEQGQAGQAMDLAISYGPQIGLAALAFMSMMMMMRVVRKSSQELNKLEGFDEQLEEEEDEGGVLRVGASAVGQALEGESLLTGKEVDDETMRFQQLGEEVSKMVEGDPMGAAELIQRWVDDQD